jgi:hypothetical protein
MQQGSSAELVRAAGDALFRPIPRCGTTSRRFAGAFFCMNYEIVSALDQGNSPASEKAMTVA